MGRGLCNISSGVLFTALFPGSMQQYTGYRDAGISNNSRAVTTQRLQQLIRQGAGSSRSHQLAQLRQLTLELSVAMQESSDMQLLLHAMQPAKPGPAAVPAAPAHPSPSAADRWAKARNRKAPPPGTSAAEAPSTSSPAAAGLRPTPSSPVIQWHPANVRQLEVLGLGSLSPILSTSTSSSDSLQDSGNTGSSATSTSLGRAAFRVHQLALSLALSHVLGPGAASNSSARIVPRYFDPAFDDWDADLITALGGQLGDSLAGCQASAVSAPTVDSATATGAAADASPAQQQQQQQASLAWLPHRGPDGVFQTSLLYMPCCTRQLYGTVLRAHMAAGPPGSGGCLPHTAILGNSFRSLAVSKGAAPRQWVLLILWSLC